MGMELEHYLTIDCSKGGPSMTKQQFADEANINKIIARFEKTGMIDSLNAREPFYGDVSDIVDYKSALETVMKAEDLFREMSAEVRNKFSNDPQQLIDFVADKANYDEAVRLGIVIPKPIPASPAVPSNATGASTAPKV